MGGDIEKSKIMLCNDDAVVEIDECGAAITGFYLKEDGINPLSFELPLTQMSPTDGMVKSFKGHFLCLQYSYGNNVYDLSTGSGEDRVALANSYSSVLNAWTPQHQNTMVPEWRDTRAGYIINEDTHWLKDGSFVRVRNIVLGYTFPTSVLSRLRMNRLRIYGSVQNAFLFCSKALNGDPETVGSTFGTGAFAQGLAYYAYPKPRMFSLGLNIVL